MAVRSSNSKNSRDSSQAGTPGRRNVLRAAAAMTGGAVLGLPGSGTSTAAAAAAAPAAGDRRPRAERTLVGAIRWDAWVGSDWTVGASVNRTLSPERYQFRLPFYADITVPQRVLLDQNFDGEAAGAAPAGWVVSSPAGTSVAVSEVPGRTGKSVHLHDASGSEPAATTRTFPSQPRAVTVQWQWKESVAGRSSGAQLRGGSTVVVDLATRENAGVKELVYRASDGTWKLVQTIADDTWYSVKVIADPAPPEGAAPWVDIFVDGLRKANHVPFRSPTASLDTLTFHTDASLTADLYVDDVGVGITESVNSDAVSQVVMDQEIQYAGAAGIDYWAFVYYPQQPLARARELYLSSAHRNAVSWCALLESNFTGNYDANLPQLVARLGDPNYQKVAGGRPLVYFFGPTMAAWVTKLRAAASQAGLPDPYVVVMGWTAQSAADQKTAVGADAVSRYVTGGTSGLSYADLAAAETGLWSQYAAAAGAVVPTVSTGWDKRPRYDYPVPWEPDYAGFKDQWVQQATPAEIATHLRGAIDWNHTHPANAPADTVLIYAWNECDEGGWICPTLFELRDSGRPLRLDAIAGVPRTGRQLSETP